MLVIVLACALIAVLSIRLANQLRGLQETPTDNLQWNITQLELDAVRLDSAILEAMTSPTADLGEVRHRFDLFYSRAGTIRRGSMLSNLGIADAAAPLMGRMERFLDRNVPLIDGPDPALRAALPRLKAQTEVLRADTRAMAVKLIDANAALQDVRRADLAAAVSNTAIAGAVLICTLLALLALVIWLNRQAVRRAQDVMRISARLEATVATALDAVVVARMDGVVIAYNDSAERMFGYTRDEAIGHTLSELIVPERHIAGHEAGMARMRATGEKRVVDSGRFDMTARRKSGEEFPVELSIASAEGPDGTIFIAYLRDITDALAAESTLISARDAAKAAEQTKTNFIAVMSHEMRTPLNGITAALDIVGRGQLDAKQGRFLDIAKDSARQLLRHVNDVLEISRIEVGQAPEVPERLDLASLMATLIEPMRPQAAQRGTTITLDMPSDLPPLVGDAFRFGQIVQNLVSNAIKFTERGRITVKVTLDHGPGDGATVTLTVQDTGIGISPADQARIFEDFVMVDPSYGRAVGGTGLGLAIVRRLVTAMQGDITLDSVLGAGSTFRVRLPMGISDATDIPAKAPPAPRALERALDVLVIEDNPTNRLVLEEMLKSLGHRVSLSNDGAHGVAQARKRRFDLVLMDLSMPGIDGWTAATLIRADGASAHSRILAVTAHARPAEDARFVEAGFDGWVTKPFTLNDLSEALAGTRPDPAAGAAAAPLVDHDRLAELGRLGKATQARLIEGARADLARCLSGLSPSMDPKAMAARLHEAAGAAAVVGAAQLHRLLQQGESACLSGALPADMLAQIDAVRQQTEAALAEA